MYVNPLREAHPKIKAWPPWWGGGGTLGVRLKPHPAKNDSAEKPKGRCWNIMCRRKPRLKLKDTNDKEEEEKKKKRTKFSTWTIFI
jgi:hypothetical protein